MLRWASAERDDVGGLERLASSSKAGPSHQPSISFDAEDEAMKQAMAYSLSDQSPLAEGVPPLQNLHPMIL